MFETDFELSNSLKKYAMEFRDLLDVNSGKLLKETLILGIFKEIIYLDGL